MPGLAMASPGPTGGEGKAKKGKKLKSPAAANGDLSHSPAAEAADPKTPKKEKKTKAAKEEGSPATNGTEVPKKKRKQSLEGEDGGASAAAPASDDSAPPAMKRAKSAAGDADGKKKTKATAAAAVAPQDEAAAIWGRAAAKDLEGQGNGAPGEAKLGGGSRAAAEKGGGKEEAAAAADGGAPDPLLVSNFSISAPIKAKLKEKGIEALFPIQAQTFGIVMDGLDLVARARTGQGKTFAFVLPVLERLLAEDNGKKGAYNRVPRVIVLVPTRELAKQVGADFEAMGNSVGLATLCVYGGAPMSPQERTLQRGVDVVVGTPGRIKDLMERGTLNLKKLRFRVLDEADEMLNMGFVDDVEAILGAVEDVGSVQTLLFSATMPTWVKQISEKFLKKEQRLVDLVGNQAMKASASVRHLLLPCHWTQRAQVVADLVACYGRNGRVIVFTETKSDAAEMAQGLSHLGARALHGDIPQAQREVVLAGFRAGTTVILVATDVAARGLDINDVQLVVQSEPPKTEESYIHRSGRTGRAGNTGVSVMLYGAKKEYMVGIIERKAGVRFERISAPQPGDVARASAAAALDAVREVSDSVVPLFRDVAQELLDTGMPPVDAVAKALARIAGHTDIKARSLLSAHGDATTLLFRAQTTVRTPSYVFGFLRRTVPEECVNEVRRMTLTKDGCGAVFDVPNAMVDDFVAASEGGEGEGSRTHVTIEVAESLPELQARPDGGSRRFELLKPKSFATTGAPLRAGLIPEGCGGGPVRAMGCRPWSIKG